jgi:hypothetical protein
LYRRLAEPDGVSAGEKVRTRVNGRLAEAYLVYLVLYLFSGRLGFASVRKCLVFQAFSRFGNIQTGVSGNRTGG